MNDLRARYLARAPGGFFLEARDLPALDAYLLERGLRPYRWRGLRRRRAGVRSATSLGHRTDSYVVRVALDDGRSLVLKQARPWLEHDPAVEAPARRAAAEARYYALVAHVPALAAHSPTVLDVDAAQGVLTLADLGDGEAVGGGEVIGDGVAAAAPAARFRESELEALVAYLATLHRHFRAYPPARPVANVAARRLRHARLFGWAANDLDPATRARITALGERYLRVRGGGETLVHGNLTPANVWRPAQAAGALRVLGASWCFSGPAELDFGTLAAHLYLGGEGERVAGAHAAYGDGLDEGLWRGFAGAEVLRAVRAEASAATSGERGRLAEEALRLLHPAAR